MSRNKFSNIAPTHSVFLLTEIAQFIEGAIVATPDHVDRPIDDK